MKNFKTLPTALPQDTIGASVSPTAVRLRLLLDSVDPVKAFRGHGLGGATKRLIAQRRLDAKTGK